ncbi:GNAT family N-acetyltransferase [Micromonospora peucetia]|uniref:GNAT family N-acetyltransferase n=1 Tax=Micromonospora peucetia TaxID=47871 RepID=A0ABZ1EJB8_9ACTN|nr:GNAT family N-acetyltransferase [Micromonospora peucetia]WSA34336.1 GNAT family N-acetyltransferase [Micromonospora peucetia]
MSQPDDNPVTVSTDLIAVLRDAGPALVSEIDRLEMIRVDQALANIGQAAKYVVLGSGQPGPLGLLTVYPVGWPYSVAPHPRLVLDGSEATRGWRTGCYLGSLGRAPAMVAVSPAAEAGPVRAALLEAGWKLVLEQSEGLDFACFPLLDDELLAAVMPLVAADDPVLVESNEAFVPVSYDSFAGYLAAQSSSRREMIRKEQRRFQAAGLRVVEVDLSARHRELAPLLRNVELKYGVAGTVEDYENYLLSIARTLGDQAICLAVFGDDDPHQSEPVAFTVIWRQDKVWRVRCWGCDYERTAGTYSYFNLVVYEPVRLAIEAGAQRLILGRGSLEAKLARGAELLRLTSVAVSLAR